MQKNKFNIGQKVIVVDGSEVVEREIATIDGTGEEVLYTLHPESNTYGFTAYMDMFLPPPPISVHSRLSERSPIMPYPDTVIKHTKKKFKQDDIFENEQDFRENVFIKRPKPSQTDLKKKLKEVADSLASTGDKEVKELLDKINL